MVRILLRSPWRTRQLAARSIKKVVETRPVLAEHLLDILSDIVYKVCDVCCVEACDCGGVWCVEACGVWRRVMCVVCGVCGGMRCVTCGGAMCYMWRCDVLYVEACYVSRCVMWRCVEYVGACDV